MIVLQDRNMSPYLHKLASAWCRDGVHFIIT